MDEQYTESIRMAENAWPMVSPILFVPRLESEYNRLVAVLEFQTFDVENGVEITLVLRIPTRLL